MLVKICVLPVSLSSSCIVTRFIVLIFHSVITCALKFRYIAGRLEYNVDKKKLKEIFRLAGKVIRVDLHTDKDGRSRGFAVVEFDHPVEAVQAISMFHNQVLYDRAMTVRMDRAADHLKLPDGLKSIGMGLGVNGEPLRDVANNLPAASSQDADNNGILGSVNPSALQVASALSSLNNTGLNSLANSSVLQANLGSLIGNRLGSDIGMGNSVGTNSLVQSQNQLAAFAAATQSTGANNIGGGIGSSLGNSSMGGFGRNEPVQDSFGSASASGFNSRNFSDYDKPKGGYGNDDYFKSGNSNMMSGSQNKMGGGVGGFSNKVLISNLPPTASYKMLLEKFNEFGDVQHLEEKGTGVMLIVYRSDWQGERAIKNLDRARIDGRSIEARPYY